MPSPFESGRTTLRMAGGELAKELMDRWKLALPRDAMGQPMGHRGEAKRLIDFANSGSLAGRDWSGGISVGPGGFRIEKGNKPGRPDWALSVSPESASILKGDVEVGGTWGSAPSAYLRKGSVRLAGGYGTPEGVPSVIGAPAGSVGGKPEAWGLVEFTSGKQPATISEEEAQWRSGLPTEDAINRMEASGRSVGEKAGPVSSLEGASPARAELERQLFEYRQKTPNWWRP